MKRANGFSNTRTITVVVLVVITVGLLSVATFRSYIDSAKSSANSSANNNKTAEEMQRVVENDMKKAEVDAMIGEPYECSEPRAFRKDGEVQDTRRCSYGNPTARSYLSVTYVSDKVWGTSYEERVDK